MDRPGCSSLLQVGAEVIPGDRDVRVTLQRYLWKARYLAYKNAGKMHKPGDSMRKGALPMLRRNAVSMLCRTPFWRQTVLVVTWATGEAHQIAAVAHAWGLQSEEPV